VRAGGGVPGRSVDAILTAARRRLQDIGLFNATDLAGGFVAWAAAGLPHQPGTALGAAPVRAG
jgi:hypothetical protein